MKDIKAYKCEYCGKVLETYSGMYKHEKKCFWNYSTKSCVTCIYLDQHKAILPVNSGYRILSQKEDLIYKHEDTNTLDFIKGNGEESDHYVLSNEWNYLYDVEHGNYCNTKKIILGKLTTNCNNHEINIAKTTKR